MRRPGRGAPVTLTGMPLSSPETYCWLPILIRSTQQWPEGDRCSDVRVTSIYQNRCAPDINIHRPSGGRARATPLLEWSRGLATWLLRQRVYSHSYTLRDSRIGSEYDLLYVWLLLGLGHRRLRDLYVESPHAIGDTNWSRVGGVVIGDIYAMSSSRADILYDRDKVATKFVNYDARIEAKRDARALWDCWGNNNTTA